MVNINVILDLANDYSINANVFHDSGNFIKEYANLCSATALFLLSLQSEDLIEKTRKDLISKCEVNIKKQENIEKLHFSSLETQTKKKRKISHANQTLISHSEASENIGKKTQILPTEEYYSESDDSVTIPVSPIKLARKSPKKKCVTGKSFSEALILASTNPQYDKRLFIELRVQYMKTTKLIFNFVYTNWYFVFVQV